jgi:hypothetical protein
MMPMRRPLQFGLLAQGALAITAYVFTQCGGSSPPPTDPSVRGPSVEVAEYEVHASGNDRFSECPPQGDLGQGWIPESATEGSHDPSVTERVITDTLRPFRSCYRRGLLRDPSQDGHVAVVIHVGPDGKVVDVGTFGACRLSSEVLDCMTDVAAKLHFDPPPGGQNTVVVPATFAPRGGYASIPPTENASYTAAAYLAIESARSGLHDCERKARREVASLSAEGTFRIDIDERGRVVSQHVGPWSGNKDLLGCAGAALERVAFPRRDGRRASVMLRIAFNPRSGGR